MSSLVGNFQQDILSRNKTTTEILRTAKLISAKLGLEDIEQWIGHELNGYPEDGALPDYRKATGTLQVQHPYYGWQLVSQGTTLMPFHQSLPNIESYAQEETVGFQPYQQISISAGGGGMDGLAKRFPQRVLFSGTVFNGMKEAVRDRLLDWSIELEKRGIMGENMSFDKGEKEKAQQQTFNIQHFTGVLGDVNHSNVQIYDYGSIHQVLREHQIPQEERNDIENILDELKSERKEKEALIERGKAWIIRNQELLGASASIVRKALGIPNVA
jgi:hypothetical protein